jgi:hypothetical protein
LLLPAFAVPLLLLRARAEDNVQEVAMKYFIAAFGMLIAFIMLSPSTTITKPPVETEIQKMAREWDARSRAKEADCKMVGGCYSLSELGLLTKEEKEVKWQEFLKRNPRFVEEIK